MRQTNFLGPLLVAGLGLIFGNAQAQESIELTRARTGLFGQAAEVVLGEAYARLGIDLTVTPLPGQRALVESSSGRKDGEVLRIGGISEKYPELIRIDTPIVSLRSGVYVRKGSDIEIGAPEDLAPYRVAILRGVVHAERNARFAASVEVVNGIDQLLKLLESDRVDAVIHTVFTTSQSIQANRRYARKITGPTIMEEIPMYHYLHKDHMKLAVQVAEMLSEMDAAGEVQSLFEAEAARLFGS